MGVARARIPSRMSSRWNPFRPICRRYESCILYHKRLASSPPAQNPRGADCGDEIPISSRPGQESFPAMDGKGFPEREVRERILPPASIVRHRSTRINRSKITAHPDARKDSRTSVSEPGGPPPGQPGRGRPGSQGCEKGFSHQRWKGFSHQHNNLSRSSTLSGCPGERTRLSWSRVAGAAFV